MRREKATQGGGEQSDEDHQSRSGCSLHLDHEALVGTDETFLMRGRQQTKSYLVAMLRPLIKKGSEAVRRGGVIGIAPPFLQPQQPDTGSS